MAAEREILITGASRGIGRAIARRLAAAGFGIVVHYRSREAAAAETLAAIREAGGKGRLLAFDIADRAAARRALEKEIETYGPPYGVVCNAGICRDAPFPGLTDEDWDEVLRTNLDGFYNVLRPLVLPMVQARRGGRIVTLSSISGLIGQRGQVNYSAAKAGIIGATKALAEELAKRQITVNCVAPGPIETEMVEGLELDQIKRAIPLRRLGQPEDVAALVGFLMSDDASYITRQVIAINGGMF